MALLMELWLPVLVVTIVLFFASFLAWAVSPHHKPDVRRWPDEERLLVFIRESGAAPGEYLFPLVDQEAMKTERGQELYAQGPWGMIRVWSSQPSMARNMVATVVYFLVVSILIAYVGAMGLPRGADFGQVFQIVGTTAVLAYCAGGVLNQIWFTRPLRGKLMNALDGLVYAVITGILFGLMWP